MVLSILFVWRLNSFYALRLSAAMISFNVYRFYSKSFVLVTRYL